MLGGYQVIQGTDPYFEGSESKMPKKDGEGSRRRSPNKGIDQNGGTKNIFEVQRTPRNENSTTLQPRQLNMDSQAADTPMILMQKCGGDESLEKEIALKRAGVSAASEASRVSENMNLEANETLNE